MASSPHPANDIEGEFETVDVMLASNAPTRGVDAFALSLIKVERQLRKLFTHLVYQFPAFGPGEVAVLRATLGSNRRVYFDGFLSGFDALYPRSASDLIGPDYARLKGRVDESVDHRNKIFHGQLSAHMLTRDELVRLADDIRSWCVALAKGATAEIGYDGFGRNSFQKGVRSKTVAKIPSPVRWCP